MMETINDIVRKVAEEMLNTSMQDITAEIIYKWAVRIGDAATCKESLQVGNAAKCKELLGEVYVLLDKSKSYIIDVESIDRRREFSHYLTRAKNLVDNIISQELGANVSVGNAAKMFEVLKNIKQEAETTCEYREYPIAGAPGARGTCPVVDADWIIDECKSVLSTPPRNCDRFNNIKEAKIRYCAEVGYVPIWDGANTEMLIKWLFAESKGEKK
jgi:hypothetical protein